MDPWNLDLRARERARSVPLRRGPSSFLPSRPPPSLRSVRAPSTRTQLARPGWDGMARIGIGVGEFIERQDTIADFIPSRI